VACTDGTAPDREFGPAPYDVRYGLADAGQLLSMTSAGSASVAYSYPKAARAGAAVVRPHAVSTVADQHFGYFPTGELKTRTAGPDGPALGLSWTPEHTVATTTGVGVSDSYVYDPAGVRVLRRGADSSVLTVDGAELVLKDGQVTARRAYTYAGVTVAVRTAAGVSWLLGDRQGSSSVTVTASGQVSRDRYRPYGATRTHEITLTDRGFLAKPHDAGTGLDVLDHRSYDPVLGRFASPDPVFQPFTPAALDTYGYAGDDPVNMSDPSGTVLPSDGGAGRACDVRCQRAYANLVRLTEMPTEQAPGFWATAAMVFVDTSARIGNDAVDTVATAGEGYGDIVVLATGGTDAVHLDRAHAPVPYANREDLSRPLASGAEVLIPGTAALKAARGAEGLLAGGRAVARSLLGRSPEATAQEATAAGDVGLSTPGLRPLPGTRVRPDGVPDNWRITGTDSAGGTRYYDPSNPGNSVRVMQGNPNSPYANSQGPYFRWQQNGQPLDMYGNKLPSAKDPAAHIPLDDFTFLPWLFQ
jgi:RHS repeat-associated protein